MGQKLDHRRDFGVRIQPQLFDLRPVDFLNVVKNPAEKFITSQNDYGPRVPVRRY